MTTTMPRTTTMRVCTFLAVLITSGCGGGDGPTDPDPGPEPPPSIGKAVIEWAVDYDNFADGRDLRVRIDRPVDATGIAELRLLVAPDDGADDLTPESALALPAERYRALGAGGDDGVEDVGAGVLDVDGAEIEEGQAYRVFVLTVAEPGFEPAARLSRAPEAVTLARTNLVRTLTPVIEAGSGGLDVDAQGRIYHADFGATLQGPPGRRVYRVTPEGDVSVFATGLAGASGNAFASNGDLFQSNIAADRISRITPDGTVSTFTSSGVENPVGIAVAPGDTLFVANCGDNTLSRVTPEGEASTFATSGLFNCPNGITLADDGNLYVANFGNGAVLKVTPDGSVSELVRLGGANNGHILFGNDVLYVVDRRGNQLVEVTLGGEVTVLAGTGERGTRDGAALEATLSLPNDVALSPDGSVLYFNDVAQTTGDFSNISPTVVRALILVEGAER